VAGSLLVAGSQNVIIQAGQVMIQAARQARAAGRDPARMLRALAVLAAPVHAPDHPDSLPPSLDLQQEWHNLAEPVRPATWWTPPKWTAAIAGGPCGRCSSHSYNRQCSPWWCYCSCGHGTTLGPRVGVE